MNLLKFLFIFLIVKIICVTCDIQQQQQQQVTQKNSKSIRFLKKMYTECEESEDFLKCLKMQAVRIGERALKIPNLKLIDGISIIQKYPTLTSRSYNEININENNGDMRHLTSKSLDQKILSIVNEFLQNHQFQINIPKLLNSETGKGSRLIEEGRKKMKKFYGPFMAAIALKGGILAMAYHSIAIVAGKALIIGKIALIISAIIGLKKLVTPEGHEKTTYEIVKHPHVQQSHTYSSSHSDYEGGHEGQGQYHRSFAINSASDKAYNAYKL